MKRNLMKSIVSLMMVVVLLAAPITASAASVARIMKVTGDYVRMRNESGAQIDRLRKGTKLLYWGDREGDMCKVMTNKGKIGYVYKAYLATYGAMPLNKVYVTTAPTKMYNSSKRGVGTLAKGKYVMVSKTNGGWAYVKTMSGKGVYVQLDNLKRAF